MQQLRLTYATSLQVTTRLLRYPRLHPELGARQRLPPNRFEQQALHHKNPVARKVHTVGRTSQGQGRRYGARLEPRQQPHRVRRGGLLLQDFR